MIEFELFNIIFDYMDDDEFMFTSSMVCNNNIFKKRRFNIYKSKRIKSLHDKIIYYNLNKDLEFDNDFDDSNKTLDNTFNTIRILSSYLLMDGLLGEKYRGHSFTKYKHYKYYISTPTMIELIRYPQHSPRNLLDFSDKVKQNTRFYQSLCQIYRMPPFQKNILKIHFRYAQALIY